MDFCGILRIFFGITKPQSAKPQSICGFLRIVLRIFADFSGILLFFYEILRNFAESLNPNRLNPNRLSAEMPPLSLLPYIGTDQSSTDYETHGP